MSTVVEQFADLRPNGGFKVILADPPWRWAAYSDKGMEKSPEQHYDTMSIDEICALPIGLLAAKDCAFFMWCTWPLMPHWLKVINALGFEYSGLAWEWLKYNPATEKYAFGPGYGTRKNVEPCLLLTKGNPQLRKDSLDGLFGVRSAPDGVRSVRDFIECNPLDAIRAPRREHSRKPDEQYNRIETLFDGPYVELFARNKRPGWVSWGNQVDKFGGEQ